MTRRSEIPQCPCHRQDGPERLGKWLEGKPLTGFTVPTYSALASYCSDRGITPEQLAKDCEWEDMGGAEAAATCRRIWERAKDVYTRYDLVPWKPLIRWYNVRVHTPQAEVFPACARCGRPCVGERGKQQKYCSPTCRETMKTRRRRGRAKPNEVTPVCTQETEGI